MTAIAPGIDPLIGEAKLRMRRRRVLIALLMLLAGAAVLTFILRPSGAPGTGSTQATHHHDTQRNALTHLKVPVDDLERKWRAGIQLMVTRSQCACGLTADGLAQLHDKVVAVVHETGAMVVRIRVWHPFGSAEVVLATATRPAEYVKHHLGPLYRLLDNSGGYAYIKVVDRRGSRIYEVYDLGNERTTGLPPRRMQGCLPGGGIWGPGDLVHPPPPCPVK